MWWSATCGCVGQRHVVVMDCMVVSPQYCGSSVPMLCLPGMCRIPPMVSKIAVITTMYIEFAKICVFEAFANEC